MGLDNLHKWTIQLVKRSPLYLTYVSFAHAMSLPSNVTNQAGVSCEVAPFLSTDDVGLYAGVLVRTLLVECDHNGYFRLVTCFHNNTWES
jgi:hypothetical protein